MTTCDNFNYLNLTGYSLENQIYLTDNCLSSTLLMVMFLFWLIFSCLSTLFFLYLYLAESVHEGSLSLTPRKRTLVLCTLFSLCKGGLTSSFYETKKENRLFLFVFFNLGKVALFSIFITGWMHRARYIFMPMAPLIMVASSALIVQDWYNLFLSSSH
jgi:hypothetical protein